MESELVHRWNEEPQTERMGYYAYQKRDVDKTGNKAKRGIGAASRRERRCDQYDIPLGEMSHCRDESVSTASRKNGHKVPLFAQLLDASAMI